MNNIKVDAIESKTQTVCLVMGGKINPNVYTDFQGQRIYHCCPMCTQKFASDPEKYFKVAESEGIVFENIQTICPVSGDQLEKKTVFSLCKGQRVFFCCDWCREQFDADPKKYLPNLDRSPEDQEFHGGHSAHHS